MAGGKRTRQVHRREDGTFETAGGVATLHATSGGNVHDHLHSLQRSYGNHAVTTLVQRKGPREKQASRDAPGYKAPPKQADFFPKDDVSKSLAARGVAWLEYTAPLELKNGTKARAAKLLEQLVYLVRRDRNQVKRWAIALHMAYGTSDAERSLYWKDVAMGKIVPEETKTIAELVKEKEAAEIAGQGD